LFYGNYTPSGEKILIRKERGEEKKEGLAPLETACIKTLI